MRPGCTEKALFLQFDCGLHAHYALCTKEKLLNPDLPFPVSFVYGERDWMDSRGSRDIIKNNKFFQSGAS
jgi:hypothetical protein